MSDVETEIQKTKTDYLTWRDENLIQKKAELNRLKELQNQTFTQIFELEDKLAEQSDDNSTTTYSLRVEIARLSRKIAALAIEMEAATLESNALCAVGSFEMYDQAMKYLQRIRNAQLVVINSSEFFRVEN